MMVFLNQVKFKEEVKENINSMIKIKSKSEIKKMSRAAEIVKDLLFELENMVKPGVTTLELDSYAENFILDQGAVPAFKGLYGFPGTLCVSINDEVVHGVPSNRELINGDIIGIDVGSIHQGFFGDHAKTFAVGSIDSNKEKLIDKDKEINVKKHFKIRIIDLHGFTLESANKEIENFIIKSMRKLYYRFLSKISNSNLTFVINNHSSPFFAFTLPISL